MQVVCLGESSLLEIASSCTLTSFPADPQTNIEVGIMQSRQVSISEFCLLQNSFLGIPYWISDTHSQGCTDLQRLITCLNHGEFVTQHAVTLL